MLSELGRRALCKLPAWVEDEAAYVEAEGGPDVSVRSYSLDEFVVRCAEDPNISPPLDRAAVAATLKALEAEGWAECRDGWRMTKAGFEKLHEPADTQGQVPGAVTIGLHPAIADSKALAG